MRRSLWVLGLSLREYDSFRMVGTKGGVDRLKYLVAALQVTKTMLLPLS